ncbi:MAG: HNH endonuclease domain-containing protein [bacterium]
MTDSRAIEFATQLVDLLDRASTTSTYKYAVLLGMLDCCQARVERDGSVPSVLTTRELARRVLEIYWVQARPFAVTGGVPQQNSGGQAKIISRIESFRQHGATSTFFAERNNPLEFQRLLNDVEWSLIQMPLPRLQLVVGTESRFIYDIAWDTSVRKGADGVAAYQKQFLDCDKPSGTFDNRILLRPGVGENLVRLGPLLRPLIQRQWSQTVAGFSGLRDGALDEFLFGIDRQALSRVVEPLMAAQEGVCFYCEKKLGKLREVDHFIPWSRSPNDGLHNLVLADQDCNGSKSNHLAEVRHLRKWRERNDPDHPMGRRFDHESEGLVWLRNPDESVSIARSLYLSVPRSMPLWRRKSVFVEADLRAIHEALA